MILIFFQFFVLKFEVKSMQFIYILCKYDVLRGVYESVCSVKKKNAFFLFGEAKFISFEH